VVQRDVISKDGGKNTSEAVDDQSFSLQRFFDMLMKGDTVATEILFAPPLESDARWDRVRDIGTSLLNRRCKGFVGYCVRQAAKYGIKGSRVGAVKRLLALIDAEIAAGRNGKLADISEALQRFAQDEEHANWVNIPSPNGSDLWHIECCDRKMPTTAAIAEARKVYALVWENYGDRARAAMTNSGIDWKAISHAVRVARQAIELLETGRITFPRPDADELLEIKKGARPYAEVSALLEQLVADVQAASDLSNLPDTSDPAIADRLVREMYLDQIKVKP
jgi:hypothetical protein